jgi:hypothetical protein
VWDSPNAMGLKTSPSHGGFMAARGSNIATLLNTNHNESLLTCINHNSPSGHATSFHYETTKHPLSWQVLASIAGLFLLQQFFIASKFQPRPRGRIRGASIGQFEISLIKKKCG